MSDRGFAVSPDPLSNGFVDNRDKRIAELETENAALKAELEIARRPHSESWKYMSDRAERAEKKVSALKAQVEVWRKAAQAEPLGLRAAFAGAMLRVQELDRQVESLTAERDAARAWAAAWRVSAHAWRREMLMPRTLAFRANLGMVSAERRARRAAEAMERR